MIFKQFDMVEVDKDGKVTDLAPSWVLAEEIVGISAIVDMHEVIVRNVANVILRVGGKMCVKGDPATIVEQLTEVKFT